MRSSFAELRKRAQTVWWVLLVGAMALLTIAAVATELGSEHVSRLAGAGTWAVAFSGCVLALVAGVGRKAAR